MTDFDLRVPMLCTKILEAIESEPKRFDMDWWRTASDDGRCNVYAEEILNGKTPACGTTMCLAGWAIHQVNSLNGYRLESELGGSTYRAGLIVFAANGIDEDALWAEDVKDHIFYVTNERALTWLREQSAREKAEASK